jgi:hypothetical protein
LLLIFAVQLSIRGVAMDGTEKHKISRTNRKFEGDMKSPYLCE